MKIHSSKFIISNTDISLCPTPNLPEFAFIGRSNVGKSSLINMLCNQKGLAKTSGKPGKTQLINHFLINENWYLVDLPGYGYAQVSKSKREKWDKFIRKYLMTRENLMCVFVLIDCRIPPQKIDLEFMNYLGSKQIPFLTIFTKADAVKNAELGKNLSAFKKEMLKEWETLPPSFVSSANKKMGRDEILDYIEELINLFDSSKITSTR